MGGRRRPTLLFDIDFTLIADKGQADKAASEGGYSKEFLEKIPFRINGIKSPYYAIHRGVMAAIFDFLVKKKYPLGFVTAGTYSKSILKDLERLYGLPAGSLYNERTLFINGNNYGGLDIPKGIKIQMARAEGKLKGKVILVDDNEEQLQSMKEYGEARDDIITVRILPLEGGKRQSDDYIEKILGAITPSKT